LDGSQYLFVVIPPKIIVNKVLELSEKNNDAESKPEDENKMDVDKKDSGEQKMKMWSIDLKCIEL